MSEDLLAQMRALVGSKGEPLVARHAVGTAAIADWCDAMGDGNPNYTDPDYAAKSVHGGIVAPAATLDIWVRPGLPAQGPAGRRGDDPQSKVIAMLEAAGYVGVVAVNSELEIARYLRPGEVLQGVQVLEDVSEEKQTGLGIGHFLTTRTRYTTSDGEYVGDLLFRILKFKPGTGASSKADDAEKPKPVPSDPSLRPRPAINLDNEALWDGYRRRELRLPQCRGCERIFFPSCPRCAECGSFDMGYFVSSGKGTLYSYAIVNYPQVPGFSYPVPVGLIELEGGARMVADLVGVGRDQLEIGMPLEVDWLDSHPAVTPDSTGAEGPITLPRFRPATPPRRTETRTIAEVAEGDALPVWVLPVTPTGITAGALSTRDFQDVHHDRDLAHKKGSADIFFNINTSIGLMERYATDWLGPDVLVHALRVRLGAPAYPYNHLTFTGSVQSVDAATGRAVVAVSAKNKLGSHINGTVEVELPR
ncbi:MAG TPA: OB-fold domain-containing protein [Mycobacteriales bacterium]|nr:OB-fold domain-containing protein [Mycobacteriales bacterium]